MRSWACDLLARASRILSSLGRGNLITVIHEDATVAMYSHLTLAGVLVLSGDAVAQGDTIGLSGNTGYSTEPRLHFSLHPCNELPGLTSWAARTSRLTGGGTPVVAQFIEGSYGIRESRAYSGPFRWSTRLQSRSGTSVNTSSSRAGSVIQLSAAISASSCPGPQPA